MIWGALNGQNLKNRQNFIPHGPLRGRHPASEELASEVADTSWCVEVLSLGQSSTRSTEFVRFWPRYPLVQRFLPPTYVQYKNIHITPPRKAVCVCFCASLPIFSMLCVNLTHLNIKHRNPRHFAQPRSLYGHIRRLRAHSYVQLKKMTTEYHPEGPFECFFTRFCPFSSFLARIKWIKTPMKCPFWTI